MDPKKSVKSAAKTAQKKTTSAAKTAQKKTTSAAKTAQKKTTSVAKTAQKKTTSVAKTAQKKTTSVAKTAKDAVAGTKPDEKALEKLGSQLRKAVLGAVNDGVGPITGSAAFAEDRMSRVRGDREAAVRRVIAESATAAGSVGFVTGVGGFAALPLTLPANIGGNLVINARMVGSIAHLRGYDLEDPHTQAVLLLTVAGSSVQSATSALGLKVGQEVAKQSIKKLPIEVIRRINQRAGFFLVAKYGTQRAAVTLVKFVPLFGGLVGGAIDASLTRAIGQLARKAFPINGGEPPEGALVGSA